jgi:CDP-diacylglycerol--glycerol-3-phosphate 3-phosphatidyltransferase
VVEQAVKKQTKSLTDLFRVWFRKPFEPIAIFFYRLGIKPNAVTIFGLIGHFAAAYLVATGKLTWGGLLLIVMAPFDYLDGMLARMRGEPWRFGAFVDSVTDRYSELVIFGALLIYYAQQQNWLGCILVYVAASGSQLVSYTRSRAETLNYPTKVGIMTRLERYLVLVPCLVFQVPDWGMWILAIFTNITALQRIFDVRRQAYQELKQKKEESR